MSVITNNLIAVKDMPDAAGELEIAKGGVTCCCGGAIGITLLVVGILCFLGIIPNMPIEGAYAMTVIGGIGVLSTLITTCVYCCKGCNAESPYK